MKLIGTLALLLTISGSAFADFSDDIERELLLSLNSNENNPDSSDDTGISDSDGGYTVEGVEEPPCDYPDINFLADTIIERLAYSESGTLIPSEYKLEDDNEGKLNAREIMIYNLDRFSRHEQSTYTCTDTGLTITIPVKWFKPLKSDFEVAPGFTRNPSFYIKATGEIHNLEADIQIDVNFVGEPSAHLHSIKVTKLRDVELGPKGYTAFRRSVRKMVSVFANGFKDMMRGAVEHNLQMILDKEMIKLDLAELGFQ